MTTVKSIVDTTRQHSVSYLLCAIVGIALLSHAVVVHPANGSPPQFEKMPVIELMPNLTGQWIAERTILNGLPSSIRAFKGPVKVEDVIAHYEDEWGSRQGMRVHHEGEWHVIATRYKRRFVSLRVRADGRGAQGIIVVSGDPADYQNDTQTEFPLPPGLQVINRQSFIDSGRQAETITLYSEHHAGLERIAIENELASAGWRQIASYNAETLHDGYNMEFSKGKQRARVFIANDEQWDNRTMILITWLQS